MTRRQVLRELLCDRAARAEPKIQLVVALVLVAVVVLLVATVLVQGLRPG